MNQKITKLKFKLFIYSINIYRVRIGILTLFVLYRSVPPLVPSRSIPFRPSFHPRAYRSVPGESFRSWKYRSVPGHIVPSPYISFRPWTYRSVPDISNFKLNNYLITFSQNSFINWWYVQGRNDKSRDGTVFPGTERYVQGRSDMLGEGTRGGTERNGTRGGTER